MSGIKIHGSLKPFKDEEKRLASLPNRSTKIALDAVLSMGFIWTQADVHVVTGSLKSSGSKSSDMPGNTWEGVISYGGASKGINNPVTYAIYEKARDGSHDFMTPLKALDSLWVDALLKVLSKK